MPDAKTDGGDYPSDISECQEIMTQDCGAEWGTKSLAPNLSSIFHLQLRP